jgi:hypothetical protein
MFKVSIAILKLCHNDLMVLDISGINDYFKAFKDDESGTSKILAPIETIIQEALKVRINDEWLDELKVQYKQLQSP